MNQFSFSTTCSRWSCWSADDIFASQQDTGLPKCSGPARVQRQLWPDSANPLHRTQWTGWPRGAAVARLTPQIALHEWGFNYQQPHTLVVAAQLPIHHEACATEAWGAISPSDMPVLLLLCGGASSTHPGFNV